jgi:hypothetical protein
MPYTLYFLDARGWRLDVGIIGLYFFEGAILKQ